jgi:molybdenum cofactor cytidylyltransferase
VPAFANSSGGGRTPALLLCCDQPLITPAILATLVETFDGASGRIVACGYGGTAGIPALFERSRFDELCSRCGDRGAQDLLRRSPEHVVQVAWPEGAVDIDRVEEYERLVGSEGGGPGAVL